MDKKGFTLIEILVVLAITALLSGLAILYTHVGQNQISLSIEESKVSQLILEARELAIATYNTSDSTCGYGVSFNVASSTYSLFAYDDAVSPAVPGGRPVCPSIAGSVDPAGGIAQYIRQYQSGSWNVHTAQGVSLEPGQANDAIEDILFYPPDPCVLISFDGNTFRTNCVPNNNPGLPSESHIYLSTVDGSLSRTITINPLGQVSL